MEVRSLSWRTDLRLRALEGAEIRDCGDCIVVRKHDVPGFRWGNFLLLSGEADDEGLRARLEEATADLIADG